MTDKTLLRPCPRCGRSFGIINCPVCEMKREYLKYDTEEWKVFTPVQGEEQGSGPASDDRSF